ncbi:hypothetical protein ANTQUA_LOCUS4171 [Anthophora quadrimaculata]
MLNNGVLSSFRNNIRRNLVLLVTRSELLYCVGNSKTLTAGHHIHYTHKTPSDISIFPSHNITNFSNNSPLRLHQTNPTTQNTNQPIFPPLHIHLTPPITVHTEFIKIKTHTARQIPSSTSKQLENEKSSSHHQILYCVQNTLFQPPPKLHL